MRNARGRIPLESVSPPKLRVERGGAWTPKPGTTRHALPLGAPADDPREALLAELQREVHALFVAMESPLGQLTDGIRDLRRMRTKGVLFVGRRVIEAESAQVDPQLVDRLALLLYRWMAKVRRTLRPEYHAVTGETYLEPGA